MSAAPLRPRRRVRRRPGLGVAAALLLAGCSLEPPERVPAPVAVVPEAYGQARLDQAYAPLHWWRAFDDPVLDRLVDRALAANLDLVEAVARLEEVRAQARIARAGLFPGVSASADVNRSSSPANTGTFGALGRAGAGQGQGQGQGGQGQGGEGGEGEGEDPPTGGIDRFETTSYSASLAAAWELDFWGRIRNDARGGAYDALAAAADVQAARIAVVGEVVSTYFEVVDLRRRIELSLLTLDVLADRTEVTEDRYARGLVTSFELYQIRQDYRNTQASLPVLEAQLSDAEGRLAVLLGAFAGRIGGDLDPVLLPRLELDPIPAGLPVQLLVQRPDVRAAAARFEAARFRVGARKAELFPSLTLNGAVGTQSDDPGGLFDVVEQWTLNLAAGVSAPLFQGGRLRAGVDAAEARYAQNAAAYTRAVLVAFRDVEAALSAYEEQSQRYRFLEAQEDEAEASADLQARRYRAGVSGYADYLDALRNLYQVRSQLSGAARDAALARLGVHRALGGGWTEDGEPPALELVPGDVPVPANGGTR